MDHQMFHGHLDYFQIPPLGVGLTQNWETMALQSLTIVDLYYFIMCEDPAWIEIHWNSIWLRALSQMTPQYTLRAHEHFFGVSQFHGHGSWLLCEVA